MQFQEVRNRSSERARHAGGAQATLERPFALEVQWHIAECRLDKAEAMLVAARRDTDPAILFLRAALQGRRGNTVLAEKLLRRAIAAEPGFAQAGLALGNVLINQFRWHDALANFDALATARPSAVEAGLWKGWTQAQLGEFGAAVDTTQALLDHAPDDGRVWLNLGNWLKAVGRGQESKAALRRAAAAEGTEAAGWWALANLKGPRFSGDDKRRMAALLAQSRDAEAQVNLHFALAQAAHETRDFGSAFQHLDRGSRIRLQGQGQRANSLVEQSAANAAAFTPDEVHRLSGSGFRCQGPVFIIGMPRAGTTLLEQILASHSQVEALGELPYVEALANEVAQIGPNLAAAVRSLSPERLQGLGRRYVALASAHRQTSAPFFIDKMPSNWLHAVLIRLMLPDAIIIDARRDAIDCCFSNFRQHFGRGHEFTYSLEHLGRTYCAYAGEMARLEAAELGIIRFDHENLLADSEGATRRLLQQVGLPFEDSCIRPHESDRCVSTPSALQVRRPITSQGSGRWKDYRQWLEPLFEALGAKGR